ncbi:larval/pupal cuticle protein H1C-like [Agrilus planipennis]|uniref:Larval/pupal cuticle protein H1C-like n=1 Tax=Agrilus planipennis TaxID=224129 RepID=A0A1W4WRQ4_AGRPL|nr:larval/pupal cuticle protein H1C-like [Agrilus planipennis]
MFKLVVLSVFLAVAAARPGFLHGEVAVAAPAVSIPSAVSHQSRTDIISSPVVATYAAPVHAAPAVAVEAYAAPAHFAYAAPAPIALPSAVSSQYRYDVHNKPLVAAYAAHTLAYSAPLPW